jgi:hypothetical protein
MGRKQETSARDRERARAIEKQNPLCKCTPCAAIPLSLQGVPSLSHSGHPNFRKQTVADRCRGSDAKKNGKRKNRQVPEKTENVTTVRVLLCFFLGFFGVAA